MSLTIEEHEHSPVIDTNVSASRNTIAEDPLAVSLEILFLPQLLLFLDFPSLCRLSLLSRGCRNAVRDDSVSIGFWPAMCNAYSVFAGLYSPVLRDPERVLARLEYRKHFLEDLWPLRGKWRVSHREGEHAESESASYKVKVACRFRPGEPPKGRVCLPLHQFLKIKRQQRQQQQLDSVDNVNNNNNNNNNNDNDDKNRKDGALLVGERDPDEFVDPILQSLMRDPVLLSPSQRVVDRSVGVQCVLRGGRDPFTGERLTADMLRPLPELAARIEAWRLSRLSRRQEDVSLDLSELKHIVDEVDPALLDALLDMQRMRQALLRAYQGEQSGDIDHTPAEDEAALAAHNAALEPVQFDSATSGDEDFVRNVLAEEQLLREEELREGLGPLNEIHASASERERDGDGDGAKNRLDKKAESARVAEIDARKACVSMHVPGAGVRPFYFSNVLAQEVEQQNAFENTTRDAVEAALNGCNACVMCYGQTGSGKTFTFLGPEKCLDDEITETLPQSMGIVLRAAQQLFQARDTLARKDIDMSLKLQIVEVYEEKLTDLLTGMNCSVRRDTGHVVGASEAPCASLADIVDNLRLAHSRQRFAETAMNQRSSRAHTALIFHVQQQSKRIPMIHDDEKNSEVSTLLLQSQLHLVDLAGSERVKKSKVTGARMREAVGINSSLLVLGKVVSALVSAQSHVPYLESKLTTLLKAAFGGNARTTVVVNARPEELHGDETLQSLRFGERCSAVSNSLRQTAASLESTLRALDSALQSTEQQLRSLAARNKQHLESYKALQASFAALQRKRQGLVDTHHTTA